MRYTWLRGTPLQNRSRKRSEEHTSELQSLTNLVCRLLLEKKNLINLLNVTLIILTLSVSRLLNLLLRLVAFLLFLNPPCVASISRRITASRSWKRCYLFAFGMYILSHVSLLCFHMYMNNSIKFLYYILYFRMQGVNFYNVVIYVDCHMSASDFLFFFF